MRFVAATAAALALVGAGLAVAKLRSHPAKPPIVFVVFDALPGSMLMKPGGELDAERFPGFAELARNSTWYRNATTVHDSTVKSIPAMLDGRWPSNLRRALVADHPVNVFTLLRRSYRIWADEEGTQLCPRTVCRQKRARLLYLLHGRREQRFAAALSQIGAPSADKRPPLWFLHVLLPHEPLRFLPSGKVYEGGSDPEPGLDGNESFDNEFLAHQAEQRHLLQLEYTDKLLQQLLARLRQTGLYDKAVIVVTADHGITFRVKGSPAEPYRLGQIGWRRDMTTYNAHDVAFVPLFVKKPGQDSAAIDDGWVRTLDILPTLLTQARVKPMPRAVAGRELGERRGAPEELQVLTNRAGLLELDPATLARRRAATIAERAARFGTGADVDRLFAIGPNAELVGRSVGSLRVLRRLNVRLWGPRRFLDVDLNGRRVPSNVIGWVDQKVAPGRALAVALNGRIAAVGRSFKPIGGLGVEFSLLVPESAFRQGRNDVRVYALRK
ncbi:MAG TPA: sulfatase-like hydrolase/transferase [Thermoleophilaceae bacterium]